MGNKDVQLNFNWIAIEFERKCETRWKQLRRWLSTRTTRKAEGKIPTDKTTTAATTATTKRFCCCKKIQFNPRRRSHDRCVHSFKKNFIHSPPPSIGILRHCRWFFQSKFVISKQFIEISINRTECSVERRHRHLSGFSGTAADSFLSWDSPRFSARYFFFFFQIFQKNET